MTQDRAIVTTKRQQKIVCDLSIGATSNDLKMTPNQILRSRHYLLLNIPETVRDRDIITIE